MSSYEPGARWTFVHSNGTRTEYILDRCMTSVGGGHAPVYALTNTATGKEAQVSTAWLGRKPSQHSHWIFEGYVEEAETA